MFVHWLAKLNYSFCKQPFPENSWSQGASWKLWFWGGLARELMGPRPFIVSWVHGYIAPFGICPSGRVCPHFVSFRCYHFVSQNRITHIAVMLSCHYRICQCGFCSLVAFEILRTISTIWDLGFSKYPKTKNFGHCVRIMWARIHVLGLSLLMP